MKKIGFLSFGHWTPSPQSQTRSAADALLQSIDLAVAAEELGADGAYFRVHHFARQLASPFPRSSSTAVMLSARSSKVGIAGSETPVPAWSKKMSRPSDVIASNQPWIVGSSGKTSQFVNWGETNTMSRGPSRDAR